MEGEEGATLEYTPTWVIAAVCFVIIAISYAMERLLHRVGDILQTKHQKPLYEALLKVKEELMLLGFISLLLTVFQSAISKICMSKELQKVMLPCKVDVHDDDVDDDDEAGHHGGSKLEIYFASTVASGTRRLLNSGSSNAVRYCGAKNKVPLMSIEALHNLHIFIFILAIVHVTFSVLTVSFGGLKIQKWKQWEEEITRENCELEKENTFERKFTHVQQHDFIKHRFLGFGKHSVILGWLTAFFKQFHASVTKADYEALRLGFIMTHCKGNPKFNFYKYMIRALEDDFKDVVGISWRLWAFVIVFLLLNVHGWYTFIWITCIPLFLLLAVGTKLEHVITSLAHDVAEKHVAIEGDLVVRPSDELFWFSNPRLVLKLIHFILFQNAFEIAFFFWIWVQFGFKSCLMGELPYIVPRITLGIFIQVICSYSTLPLYAIVTQMGSTFNKAIFDDHVQASLLGWAKMVKKKQALKLAAQESPSGRHSVSIQIEDDSIVDAAAPEEKDPEKASGDAK
ncbi:MILDEW RESISTANCE LOCUS O 1 [Hibiscus trionum]|uniref:MLO-like protein n=1 Tax=Hibiscus trionum TaxID=183268 RepID=A0A9W7GV37_HIBTR|nr:MILDEW RESISTANCE LOCUS O 1 [Hibiscus trionum]